LLESLELWTRTLDQGHGLDIIYLDYRKAFDSVPHKRLLAKLRSYGISGKLLDWIENFLTDRTMRVGVRGALSRLVNVLSGVPQGSVLGPLLFLLFVNDLPEWIKCDIRMFADDTKIWNVIRRESDSEKLQDDIDNLTGWSQRWLLKFNPDKCKVMHVGHKLQTRYFMAEGNSKTEIMPVQEEKDLGVIFTRDLKPSIQCRKSAAKARRIIGMVRRSFRKLDTQDFLLIYKTYIRPHLEYSIQAWSPHLTKDIDILERTQRAATNLVPALRRLSYETRLKRLGITTLQTRRIRGDLIETYKIMTGRENVDRTQFFRLATNEHGLRGHRMRIKKERARLDLRKYFFANRVVQHWNRLPQRVIDATSVNGFKNALDRFWLDMDANSRPA
jgi:ribonucleases P/MRP protein subunit RPP40